MTIETESNIPPSAKPFHVEIGAQCNDHSAFLAGVSAKQFFTDASTFARVQLLITEYYQLDVLSNFWDVYNIEAEVYFGFHWQTQGCWSGAQGNCQACQGNQLYGFHAGSGLFAICRYFI